MSLAQILEELPAFTVAERQLLVRRAIELDDTVLPAEDEKLVTARLEAHQSDPSTAVSLEVMKASLRAGLNR
mgnify:CR=1 FL=1|jgi:hypothetical protein